MRWRTRHESLAYLLFEMSDLGTDGGAGMATAVEQSHLQTNAWQFYRGVMHNGCRGESS
jgi:hypothetical protein